MERDTLSFPGLISNGLNIPEPPSTEDGEREMSSIYRPMPSGVKTTSSDPSNSKTSVPVVAPKGETGDTHLLFSVIDDGKPFLTRYCKRLIIHIN